MLKCKDFVPVITKKQAMRIGFTETAPEVTECEDFGFAIKAAGEWLDRSGVRLVQLETVVLPNIWSEAETGPQDTSVQFVGGVKANFWHQFIRVWYTVDHDRDPYR